jgi:hypothetical protein
MDSPLVDIIQLCHLADRKAVKAYADLARGTADAELAAFWTELSRQEVEHVHHWQAAAGYAERGWLPQVFERPLEVLAGLREAHRSIDRLVATLGPEPTVPVSFGIAAELELIMLHPSFGALFEVMASLSGDTRFLDAYSAHLDGFVRVLRDRVPGDPALEGLGASILGRWQRSKLLGL